MLIGLTVAAAPLAQIALTAFLVNPRHVFYAPSFPLHGADVWPSARSPSGARPGLLAGASFPLHGLSAGQLGEDAIQVEVRTHEGLLGGRPHGLAALTSEAQPRFRVEVR